MKSGRGAYTPLVLKFEEGTDPDDVYSSVAYEVSLLLPSLASLLL
jgi:hypothetical protein